MYQKYLAFMMKISIFVMVLSLTACSGATEPSVSPETSTPANEAVTAPAAENEKAPEVTRPQIENFDMMTGEGNQTLTATLHQGEDFSLYVFEKFAFDAAEGRLFLSSNPEYEVKIESLPANYDLAQLETEGREALEKFGEVSDFSGELVEHPLGSAELYLQSSSGEGINDYIVWLSETGDAFLFRLHNPKGEEAADFAGPVLVSLSTVQVDS
ncbi:hypothetical protein [Paenibacillus macerans]|uniref:hypothetical protein n=1 Tax=Paenibacillus macerans TaxID=44252 RepID=UPI003D319CAA